MKSFIGLLLLFFTTPAHAQPPRHSIDDAGATELMSRIPIFNNWPQSTWWTQSHNIDGLLDWEPHSYHFLNASFFWLAWRPWFNYINNIYDDQGWWALAWLHAYTASVADHNPQPKFLKRVLAIRNNIQNNAWVDTCGKSLIYKHSNPYQNAVTNGIYGVLNMRLFELTKDPAYKTEAQKILDWFNQSKLDDNAEGLVNDGLTVNDPKCSVNPNGQFWSYNQGLYIELFTRFGLIDRAWKLFETSSHYFINPSTHALDEVNCEPAVRKPRVASLKDNCGVDGVEFRGVFLKMLHTLGHVLYEQCDPRFYKLKEFADQQAHLVLISKKDSHQWYPEHWNSNTSPMQYTPVTHMVATEALLLADDLDQLSF